MLPFVWGTWHILWKICNNVIVKYPTKPQLRKRARPNYLLPRSRLRPHFWSQDNDYGLDSRDHILLSISTPMSHYCQQLTLFSVPLSYPFKSIQNHFGFSMESSHFLAFISPCGTLQNVVLRFFDLGPLTPKIYSPRLLATKSPISRLLWQIDMRCLGLPWGFRGWPIQ